MNTNEFTQQMKKVYNRAGNLYQRAGESHVIEYPALLVDSLEELRTSLEELRVAEEELRQQNEELQSTRETVEAERQRYQELFEFAPDGYLVTDADGTIREANRAAADLLGIAHNYLMGKPLIIFISQEERRAFRTKLLRLREGGSEREWEVVVKPRRDNCFHAALTVASVRDRQDKVVSLRWIMRDITARKEAEEKIRTYHLQNLQLQEASRLKSQFLALMSHELRTPMNAIIGFSQLLLRQRNHHLPPSQANMVERILNSGKHLLKMIEEILDFSKLEAGRLDLDLAEFNVAALVMETVEELRCLAEQKQLELNIQCCLDNPCVVNDKARLRQVLINLISNAIKFTDSGSISLEAQELSDNRVAIAVKDTGIGIDQSDLQQIFQEFRQLNQSLTRDKGGTGLGLAISDRLVRMMQGKIKVESQLGEGSTFQVELPRQIPVELEVLS
ncbi:ATP-binding protein [Funiculus sociatus GB2-A5]|uniref:histidine kinase n=1 Tax=Funiculus sociatus GB2-A5 TaxID=2933946 RepID=A0ABV0JLB4_9CYAN|nr:ATP-binding protein [Trichocoleus sp. FACHB-6]MBD2065510.1 PAS domain S-box protein [Trichocoleus sp. FACHB-6]